MDLIHKRPIKYNITGRINIIKTRALIIWHPPGGGSLIVGPGIYNSECQIIKVIQRLTIIWILSYSSINIKSLNPKSCTSVVCVQNPIWYIVKPSQIDG